MPSRINKIFLLLTLNMLVPRADTARAGSPMEWEDGGRAIAAGEIGREAEKNYSGDGLRIDLLPGGAWLKSDFQKLEGLATSDGLWLSSTEGPEGDGNPGVEPMRENTPDFWREPAGPLFGERFRVLATAVGRQGPAGERLCPLSPAGEVSGDKYLVTFQRPGLVEEYRVGVDGVRQDFVVEKRPEGEGALSLSLQVSGARASGAEYGAMLTLSGSGRGIAYSRLLVTDAAGRTLKARLEVPAPDQVRVVVEDTDAAYPVRIDPTFSDADWVAVDSGLNGTVRALAVRGSIIFVGGDFTKAGTAAALRMARWTGGKWFAMGAGMDAPVYTLVVSGADLYAGGRFSTAGGVEAKGIAKWDNSAWSSLGVAPNNGVAGTNYEVRALAARGTDVYVAGTFGKAGAVTVQNIAKWASATSAWSALGAGVNGPVNALTFSSSVLFAGGSFGGAGTVSALNIARWNGTAWAAMGTGVSGAVLALTANAPEVYVGGSFSQAGGIASGRVAKWNDTTKTWTPLGAGLTGGEVNALVFTGADLYAGAGSNVSRWNGQRWAAAGSGTNGGVRAMIADGANHLLVGGDFSSAGNKSSLYLAQLNLPTGPDLSLFEAGDPVELLNGQTEVVDFGEIDPGSPVVKTFTLQNDGIAALNVTGLTLPAGFEQVGAGVPVTLAPAANANFQVRFKGAAASGDYPGNMILASNDPDEAAFTIHITGRVRTTETPQQSWRKLYFSTTANEGNAADNADPDHDGIPNLLEWACYLNPVTSGPLPLSFDRGSAGPDAPFEFIYTRSKSAKSAGAVYAVEWNNTLPGDVGTWSTTGVSESIVSGNADTEQVKALVPRDGQNRRFARLRVTSPAGG